LVSPQKDFSSFDIYHAKFFAGGNAFGRYIQYYVQAGAASNSRQPSFAPPAESGDGGFTLEDYYVRFSKEGFNFKFGQFKTPFGRQWMTYSGNFQFVDRSLVSYFHQFGRDRGVTFNGTRETFAFSLGVFNGGGSPSMGSGLSPRTFSGNGQNVSNDTAGGGRGHLYLARIVAMPFKTTGYSEGDVALSEGARLDWGVGVAFDHDRDVDINGDAVVDDVDADVLAVGTDLVFKRDGLSAQAEFFYRDIRGNTAVDSHGLGAYIQTGYFFIASQFETALRFGFIEPDMDTSDDQILEGAAALNLYIFRDHRYKTQLQYTWRGQDTALGGRNDDHFVDLLFQFTI
jgi:phosphate-selective porin